MATVTPDFETFLVRSDGGKWRKCGKTLAWKLKSGTNRLEMRVRTRAGVLGKASHLVVQNK